MFKKILATSVLVTFLASTALAQVETMSAPGKSLPVESETSEEGIPLLNSAPVDPSASMTLSEITVEPATSEAVFTFSTSEATHIVIEYGLTPEYDRSISTEPQTTHTETIGELTACTQYYYSVRAGEESREGDFKTLCPVVAKTAKKPAAKKTPIAPVVPVPEPALVLNAAPEEVQTTETVQNEEAVIEEETPEIPAQPVLIATDEMETPSAAPSKTPVALIIFALLSGIVVAFFTFKKQKKWYQR